MARTYDEPDDEYDGDEYDAETDYDPADPETYPAGVYADDDRAVVACPYCRAEIDEEAERCPNCGNYITDEGAPRERKSVTWIVLMALALLVALAWVVM